MSYSYQWYADGRAISGTTGSSLVLKSAQKGKKITVKVTAHRTGHKDGSAVGRPTRTVVR
ncbi:glycoside hydrolase Chb [Streptomyces sp. NPDC005708]|uniref:glycoside hydrolase Chb n=1 Tax=Streptomyces sp. NPDC005708 TaxID=3154564 RepID=UPI0033C6C971